MQGEASIPHAAAGTFLDELEVYDDRRILLGAVRRSFGAGQPEAFVAS